MRTAALTAAFAAALLPTLAPLAFAAGNQDESKVGAYTLPDPLTLNDGTKVTNPATWWHQRRPELFDMLQENQYGKCPPKPADLAFDVYDTDPHALHDTAIRKQITILFNGKKDGPHAHLLMYLPKAATDHPVPVLLGLVFVPVHELTSDPAVTITPAWDTVHKKAQFTPAESTRNSHPDDFPIEKILSHGYGAAAICYNDIEPDFNGAWKFGVRSLTPPPDGKTFPPDAWGAVAAWGWGLSRAQDYLETDKDVDPRHTAIFGWSRLGKATVWAGARDQRFAIVMPSCSGEGGAALSHRNYGETIADLNKHFPWWFCGNYKKFSGHFADLPFDSHFILSLIAPRPLFLNTGSQDHWSDPKGEFLAAIAATPVYHLLGKPGLDTTTFPPLDTPVGHTITFNCHTGKHGTFPPDWDKMLDFMDQQLKAVPTSRPDRMRQPR